MIGLPSLAGTVVAPWSPKALTSLYQWFDAMDLSTITKDVSNNVTQWADKSGNGGHLTATGTNGAIYSATGLNSKPTLTFATSDGLLNETAHGLAFLRNQQSATIMMAMESTGHVDNRIYFFWSTGENAGAGRFYITDDDSLRNVVSIRQADGGSRVDKATSASYLFPASGALVWRTSIDLANKLFYQYVNTQGDTQDIQQTAALATSDAFSDTASLSSEFGGGPILRPSAAGYKISELILTRSVLSANEIVKVNQYLKAKWGIA